MVRLRNKRSDRTGCTGPRVPMVKYPGSVVRAVLVFLNLSLFVPALHAQDVRVTARVDSNNIVIGDWLNLHVEVRHPGGRAVQLISPDSLEGFEIIRRDSVRRSNIDNEVVEATRLTITSYDTGRFVIPPFSVKYRSDNGTTGTAESWPIPVFVQGMAVDTTRDIKDIKQPITLGISLADVLPYVIGIIVLGAIVWLVYYVRKKRKKGERLIPPPPARPPHEVALEALRSLEAEKMWQRGKTKEYHSTLTEIIRLFIERRFGVMALEMITDEILAAESIKGLDNEIHDHLKDLLTLADLVKFAKFQPVAEENKRSIRSAFSFVEQTWRQKTDIVQRQVTEEMAA